ncbi:MAG: Nramp family divalent metal transporter, partial [Vicinamibacterales bacterium]
GFDQPLILLVVAACLNGMVMFVYSFLLIQLNRRALPTALRVRGLRLGMLIFATMFYGFFAGWLVVVQVQSYLSGA